MSFSALVATPRNFNVIEHCEHPIAGKLTFNPNPNVPAKFGTFKKAFSGYVSHQVIGPRLYVCIKQCWYSPTATSQHLIYDNATQASKLTSEMNCLRWSDALMDIVQKFMDRFIEARGPPPFPIPEVRFVRSALCVLENRDVYLIEEFIDGDFVKYIRNNSAVPFAFFDQDLSRCAQFLSFCQHVQYIKTEGSAFVGDFQDI